MNETMIIWTMIVTSIVLAFLFRAIERFRVSALPSNVSLPLVELSNDRDVFYCPGDEIFETEDSDEL